MIIHTNDEVLKDYIESNLRQLLEEFVSQQEAEFIEFCKEDMKMVGLEDKK